MKLPTDAKIGESEGCIFIQENTLPLTRGEMESMVEESQSREAVASGKALAIAQDCAMMAASMSTTRTTLLRAIRGMDPMEVSPELYDVVSNLAQYERELIQKFNRRDK